MEATQRSLIEAARAGNIDALYETLRRVPKILDEIDEIPFVNTPLHEAAWAGQTHFAIEIMGLKPSFGKKLNQDGRSPLHLALRNRCSETVKRLVRYDSELIRVKGREQQTPLHYVAETGDIDTLAEFLCACPQSIKELTIREETAMHIAIKRYNVQAFRVIFMWLYKTSRDEVLNWKDEDGNTALHIAAATNQPEIVRLIVKKKGTYCRNERNLGGLTARDIASRLGPDAAGIRKILGRPKATSPSEEGINLADFLLSPDYFGERTMRHVLHRCKQMPIEMQNVVLVVAALIATATFTAILTPPDILKRTDVNIKESPSPTAAPAATRNLPINTVEYWFYFSNTVAFAWSIVVINLVASWTPFSSLLNGSLIYWTVAYCLSMYSVAPSASGAVVVMTIPFACLFICFLFNDFFWDAEMRMEMKMKMKMKVEMPGLLYGLKRSRIRLPLLGSAERLRMLFRLMG